MNKSQGIGFITGGRAETPRGFLVALDYDACRNATTGEIEPWAKKAIAELKSSFTEVSPSGFGLRQWVLVNHLPIERVQTVIDIDTDPVDGCNKNVEVQLFGVNPTGGGYVTVTGEHLDDTQREVLRIDDWRDIYRAFDATPDIQAGPLVELPTGNGFTPSNDFIELAIRDAPNGEEILNGDWFAAGYKSASEAFFRLEQLTLEATEGDGQAALEFLLHHTKWGRGDIEDSRDPDVYAREDWVRKDLLRACGKLQPSTADAFDVVETDDIEPEKTFKHLTLPADEWVQTVGNLSFIIKDWMPEQGTFQVIGAPGCGKSQMMLSLAFALTTGQKEWFGMPLLKHGAVLFIVGEGRQGFANRIRAEARRRGIDIPKNLHVNTVPAELDDPATVKAWLKWIKQEIGDVAMFVTDTLTSNTGADFEENDVKAMKTLLQMGTRIADTLQCAVGYVHHTGYNNQHRGRGSSAQKGAIDCDFIVTKQEVDAEVEEEACTASGNALEITMAPDRTKDWPQGDKVVGSVRSVPVADGAEETAPVLAEQPVTRVDIDVFDADDEDGEEGLLGYYRRRQGETMTRRDVVADTGMSEWAVRRDTERLVTEGRLTVTKQPGGGAVYTVDDG